MSPRCSHALLFAWLALACAIARAQPAPEASAGAPSSAAERERLARALYEEGLTHYNLHEYDAAIAAFKGSYRLSRAPELLFDIAQEYRLKGDCPEALRFYRTYLREDVRSPKRARVEAWIAEMERCDRPPPAPPAASVTAPSAEPPPRVEPPAIPPAAALTPPPPTTALPAFANAPAPPREGGRRKKIAGLVLVGAGLALVGGAAYLSSRASSDGGEVSALYQRGGPWDAHYASVDSDGARSSGAAIALLAIGAAAMVGGAVVAALGWRAPRALVAFSPSQNGAALEVTCSF